MKIYSIGLFVVAFIFTILLWQGIELDLLLSWLIAITAVTFGAFGFDKAMAKAGRGRISETVLLTLTFTGGTVGALLGRSMFNHKTTKRGFRAKFWVVVLVQIIVIVAYYYWKFTRGT